MSILSGSSVILTSNLSCTWLRTSESEAEETKVSAKPLVPKRPALPTYKPKNQQLKIISFE